MSPDVHSHCEQRRLLFDLPSLNDECDLTAKPEVHWNMHLYNKLQALNSECMSMGLSLYLRKSDSHSGIIAFIGLATAFYELFEQHLRCLNAREDIDIEPRTSRRRATCVGAPSQPRKRTVPRESRAVEPCLCPLRTNASICSSPAPKEATTSAPWGDAGGAVGGGCGEVRTSVQSQLVDMERHRCQPANVQHLLLERSLHPVRHRLICRVHRLSRRPWRKIKATDRPEERSSASPTTLSSVEVVEGNVLPPESAVTDPKSSQDEMVVFENKMVPRKFSSDDSGVGITKVTFTLTPRRLGQKPQQGEHFVMTIHVEGIFYEKILSLIALTAYLKHLLVTRLLLVVKFEGIAFGNKGGSEHTHSRMVCHNGLRRGAHACYVGSHHLQQPRLRQWMEQPETVE
uniref:Uncharacterized protein n=1 Tax=Echinococcus canadensis TaxID=519352 RepID=A0A915EUE7_9CEST